MELNKSFFKKNHPGNVLSRAAGFKRFYPKSVKDALGSLFAACRDSGGK
jgi:hypothetical protein